MSQMMTKEHMKKIVAKLKILIYLAHQVFLDIKEKMNDSKKQSKWLDEKVWALL